MPKLSSSDIPHELLSVRKSDLQELYNDQELIQSARDSLPDAQALRKDALELHKNNIQRVERLKDQIRAIENIQSQIDDLLSLKAKNDAQVRETEEKLIEALAPYSASRAKYLAASQISTLKVELNEFERQFLQNTKLNAEDAVSLANKYVECRQKLYYLENMQDALDSI